MTTTNKKQIEQQQTKKNVTKTSFPIKSDTKNTHTTTTTKQTNLNKTKQKNKKTKKIQTHLILNIKQNEHRVIKHENSKQILSNKS